MTNVSLEVANFMIRNVTVTPQNKLDFWNTHETGEGVFSLNLCDFRQIFYLLYFVMQLCNKNTFDTFSRVLKSAWQILKSLEKDVHASFRIREYFPHQVTAQPNPQTGMLLRKAFVVGM